ncbi:hypothetical protein OHC33_007791 [Knufia fluminis]|uniref:BTB domain-containing protein n=1 Tax=Knufia fluminis TaxID=191047 RepID=A0AAN8EGM7_9EURO|nr:hypothetical protein OHC33_007791 [Knufia fluminis]
MAFQTTEISRTGDIVLVVGEDTKTALRLRVESYMLRRASKAFDVMFGPRFGEGQNITASNPKDIPLPEDDPDMMKLVCHILHFQSSVVPGTICASDTYKLAKLVDKYFLHDAVRLALDRAFNIEASMLSADRIQLLRAAILLQNDDYYKVVTKSMIMECNGPYSGLYNEDGEEFTVEDHSLASALEVERSRLRILIAPTSFASLQPGYLVIRLTMAVETTNIVDRGDVILVLGEGDTSLQLKVNSQMLRAGSEVFEAMFGGNFAEGQNLSYDKPKEVNLEDDPQAMKVICLVLHFKYKQVPDLLDVQEVYNLAVVVDKFQARVMSNLRNVGVTPNYIAGVSLYTIFALTRQKLTLPGPGLDPLCDKVNHAPMYWLRKKLIENVERIADFSGISLDWLK